VVGDECDARLPRGPEQHLIPVVIQELALARREPADVDQSVRLDPHAFQGGSMGDRRDYQRTVVLEADEPPVKEVVDARREQEPVLAVKHFGVPLGRSSWRFRPVRPMTPTDHA